MRLEPQIIGQGPAPALDLDAISIYGDGSGKASEYLESALKILDERDAVTKILRLFITKHGDTLAGSFWRIGWRTEPEITISFGSYRGVRTSAKAMARLWPGATWKREKPTYGREQERDWVAKVDAVTLRMEGVEKYQKYHIPADGPVRV